MQSTVALGVVAVIIMLSMFFGQYRWLAKQIVATSTEQHYAFLQGSFERRARSQIHAVANALPVANATGDTGVVSLTLDRALSANDGLTGIRFTSSGGQSWESGSLPVVEDLRATTWLANRFVVSLSLIHI